MYISTQALSKQIKQLEKQLGYPLLQRNTAHVRLTPAGEKLVARFTPLYEQWREAWDASVLKKQVTMAFFASLPQEEVLSKVIDLMVTTNPEWNIRLIGKDILEVVDVIKNKEADLALTCCHTGEYWENCEKIPLLPLRPLLLLSAKDPLAERISDEVDIEDIENAKFVFITTKQIDEKSFYFKMMQKKHDILFVEDTHSMLQEVRLGKGMAVVPDLGDLYKDKAIKAVPLINSFEMQFEICLIYPTQHVMKREFQLLAERCQL